MSQIVLESFGQFAEFTVGWDPPIGRFFAQGVLAGEDVPAMWEHYATLSELVRDISGCGFNLPDAVLEKLAQHGRTNSDERLMWHTTEQQLW
ncbi:MAG: hypothetical protein A2341_19735 [Deltaproteobacteria bacterium RIFOXYB12_FULL_58_9]|nr:MAG: hypothetical protein A2341_19735 [Deltaproteobacteria bacterium RIFOXYB12_FULL_58_9]